MKTQEQSDNESLPLLQHKNTYRRFLASVFELITIPLQIPVNALALRSTDENPSSTPTLLPGSYPLDRCSSIESAALEDSEDDLPQPPSARLPVAEDVTNSASQAIEELGYYDLSAASHSLSQSNRLEEHAALSGQPELPAVSHFAEDCRDVRSRDKNTPEAPFTNCGNEDEHSTEARGGVDPDLLTPTVEASNVATNSTFASLFQRASNFQISNTSITAIGGNATIFQFGSGQYTEAQRNLICDHIATFTALPDINDKLKRHVLTQMIVLLPRAEAVFNDYQNKKKSGPCFEGTRVALLREMANWVTSQDESRMYILSGLAGIGKSTIAYTIASRAADLNLLGASFFFSRDEADRNNAKKFFTTVAYQLCVYDEHFAKAIGDVLLTERGSAATTKDLQEQLQVLILNPLRSIVQSCARQILLVVDALDECGEDDVYGVLAGLSRLVRDMPSFKVILTTRPLPYLDYFLHNKGGHKFCHLPDIEEKVVDGDIRLYLRYNLSLEQVRERYPRRKWCASDEQIEALVRAAGRLFIIASTAVRYILDKSVSNPAAQAQKLFRACADNYTPFKDLDHFYTIILRNVVPENCDNDDIVCRYRSVVGAIIFISRPLPVSTLAHFTDIDPEEIHVVLEKLQSVILLDDGDIPRIYHKSLPDYLTDQARCKDCCLRIDPRIVHTQIATRCYRILNKHLKYNILGLGNVARYMSNEDGLKKDMITAVQLQEKIPQQLHYACVYWADHLDSEGATVGDSDLMNGLETFMDEHILHWFEVLSLIGHLDSGHRGIRVVLNLWKSTSSDLRQLLSDALRFISKFYTIIERSALHTYYSALPFSPTGSLLYRRYIKEVEHDILCHIDGGLKKWDALIANLNHGEGVDVIKFSLDSILFVSYSRKYEDHDIRKTPEGVMKVWDTATGTPISTIQGHRFAFTNDLSTIASSADNVITYYNVDGSTRNTIITASSKIEELALSECSRVAAALSDGTVWLWESRNCELINSFDGFESTSPPRLPELQHKTQFQFSPTGTRLAYPSINGIVKLRDGITGRLIADLRCGSNRKFEFSGDGFRIASLSRDCGLSLWSAESGGLVAVRDVGDRVDSDVWPIWAISANGSLLATVDLGNTVTLWSENRHHLAEIEVLELKNTGSMAFSLDNILAIGSYSGIHLYNTNTHSFVSALPLGGRPLVFSPYRTHIACGNYGNVYLWDMQGIDDSSPLSKEKTIWATAIALSRDCSRLACGFEGGTFEIWETSPTKRRIASHQGDLVSAVGFAPDGRLCASGSIYGTITLWNGGDGSLHGTQLHSSFGLRAVALSSSVLIAAGNDVRLWKLDTLSLIHTFEISPRHVTTVSISDESALATIGFDDDSIYLIDVVNHTIIATFAVDFSIHNLSFLPDKSRLIAQTEGGDFLSLNLINNSITKGSTLEHLIQLPDIPLWHGVPIWPCRNYQQCYIAALFPQHQTPVPVLWIPGDIPVDRWVQGSSMIALCCKDGRIILLRLSTIHVD